MKKLIALSVLVIAAFYSCGKEQPTENGTKPAEKILVTGFELHNSYLQIGQHMTEGLVLQIDEIAPRKAPLSLLQCTVENKDIVSVSRDDYGFRLFPKAVGTTSVTISTTSGPAASKTCTVEVMAKADYNTPEITSITADQTKVELSDQPSSGGAMQGDRVDVNISLVPEDAKLDATIIYTDRPDILYVTPMNNRLRIEAEPNLDDKESVTGTFHIYVKPKRGTAKALEITVDVFGHVYGAQFNGIKEGVKGVELIGSELGLNIDKGDEVKILPEVLATGPLKSSDTPVTIGLCEVYGTGLTPSSESCIEISESGVLKAKANTVHSTAKFYVAAYQKVSLPLAKFPIVIYDPAEKVNILCKSADADHIYTVGDNCKFQAAIIPSTARQEFDWEFNDGYLQEVKRENKYTIELKCIKGSFIGETLIAKCLNGSARGSIGIKVDDYRASDIKPGDWVYYSASSGAFRVSDGGLRLFESDSKCRDENLAPTPSKSEEVVGVIYDIDVDASAFPVKLAGYSGKHFRAISVADTDMYKWSDSKLSSSDFDQKWNSCGAYDKYGRAPFTGHTNDLASTTFKQNLGWLTFNEAESSNKLLAISGPSDYAGAHPIKVATQYAGGASGWLLMSVEDAKLLNNYFSVIQSSRLKNSGMGFKQFGAEYWSCNYYTDSGKAMLISVGKSSVSTKETARYNKAPTRPIFYL